MMNYSKEAKIEDSRRTLCAILLLSIAVSAIYHVPCFAQQPSPQNANGLVYHLNLVKKDMKPLNLSHPSALSSSARKYLTVIVIDYKNTLILAVLKLLIIVKM